MSLWDPRTEARWAQLIRPSDAGIPKPSLEASKLRIGDPVHETLTLEALARASIVPKNAKESRRRGFLRGIFWNDDPCGQLFASDSTLKPSWGLKWYLDFTTAEERARNGSAELAGLECGLLARSHFGDLQFLHAMADGDEIEAEKTRAKVMAWAELTYGFAVGTHAVDQKLSESKFPLAGELRLPADMSFRRLVRTSENADARERAIGALLHTIQDSYGLGHVRREVNDGRYGAIMQFHSYARQDHKKHRNDDLWQGGDTDIERILKFKGGSEALEASKAVLAYFARKPAPAPWTEVKAYLEQGPFRLASKTRVSGP